MFLPERLAAAIDALAKSHDGVPYNSVMAVSVGPGGAGKTSLRLAIQNKPLPQKRVSTKGGDSQLLAVRHGQMLGLVEVDSGESRVAQAVLQQMLGSRQDQGMPAEMPASSDSLAAAEKRQQQLSQQGKALVVLPSEEKDAVAVGEAAAVASKPAHRPAPPVKPDDSAVTSAPALTAAAKQPAGEKSAPRPVAAEELHFARDGDTVLSRLADLQQQGSTEGVHVTFYDMGGQPEFAGLAAQFLRE